MKIQRAYKVRLYPNLAQEMELWRIINASRFVYNYFLASRKGYYEETGKTLTLNQMSSDLTVLRKSVGFLDGIQLEPLSQGLRRLDRSYQTFFRQKKGYPKFKTKKSSHQSFQKHTAWKIIDKKVQIQTGLVVKFRGLVDTQAQLGTLTVLYSCGKWYASMTAQVEMKLPIRHSKPIGIDLGLTSLASISTGIKFENIQPQKTLQNKLARAQRVLARRVKGSNRREKAKVEVARVYEKTGAIRRNHLHQVSSAITAKNHSLIAVEDLNVRGMFRNRKLSRAISDAGWSELLRQIEYKQLWEGGEIVKVGRYFPSSKLCSACGFLAETMPLSVRNWKCACGVEHDRDVNAAKNILTEAYSVRGADVRPSRQLALKRGQQ